MRRGCDKVTDKERANIARLYLEEDVTYTALRDRFGYSRETIGKIVKAARPHYDALKRSQATTDKFARGEHL